MPAQLGAPGRFQGWRVSVTVPGLPERTVMDVTRVLGPPLEHGGRVGAGGEAQRRLLLTCEVDQRMGELAPHSSAVRQTRSSAGNVLG